MRFASCRHDGRRFAALVDGDHVRPLAGVEELGSCTDSALLADPPLAAEPPLRLDDVELAPAIPNPGKIICLGLNYRSHVDETGRELPHYPVLFTKFAETLTGPFSPIGKPPECTELDYEAELAVIIGRRARRVAATDARGIVAGYAAANDVTARDYQYRSHQWLQGKAWAATTPLGPFLVTADEVGDPGTLDIRLELNGREMQRSTTALMIFDVPTILATVSEFMTLEPGDVILTGTPGGVGHRRDPQVFLEPGDVVRVAIERVGAIENEIVAERVPKT
jgi:acylpyruvate hydrolase